MINVQEAVQLALKYCGQLFGEVEGLRLEEVELSEDEKHWFITVGFNEPMPKAAPGTWAAALADLGPGTVGRQYKVVNLDAQTGKIRAVKIRQPLERVS